MGEQKDFSWGWNSKKISCYPLETKRTAFCGETNFGKISNFNIKGSQDSSSPLSDVHACTRLVEIMICIQFYWFGGIFSSHWRCAFNVAGSRNGGQFFLGFGSSLFANNSLELLFSWCRIDIAYSTYTISACMSCPWLYILK